MSRQEQLEALLAKDPQSAFLQYALALEVIKLGDQADGLKRLESLTHSHPEFVPAYHQWGRLLYESGEQDAAGQVLTRGVAIARSVGDAHAEAEMQGLLDLI